MLHWYWRAGRPAFGSISTGPGPGLGAVVGNWPGSKFGQAGGYPLAGYPCARVVTGSPKLVCTTEAEDPASPLAELLFTAVPPYTIPNPARNTVLGVIW